MEENKLCFDNDYFFGEVIRFLREGKEVTITGKGVSMIPTIRNGEDSIEIVGIEAGSKEGSYQKAQVDDIVLFKYHDRWIVHRVISIKDGSAVIRGDGVYKKCEYPRLEDIYGKVIYIYRDGNRKVDPYSPKAMRFLRLWKRLLPIRRYLLAIYHRLHLNISYP